MPARELAIADEADLVHARRLLRAESLSAGLGLVDQTRLVTAGSELTRNILSYATGGRGRLLVEQVSLPGRRGIRATFTDNGPGIEDLDKALADGFPPAAAWGLACWGRKGW